MSFYRFCLKRTTRIVLQAVDTGHIPAPVLATKRFFAGTAPTKQQRNGSSHKRAFPGIKPHGGHSAIPASKATHTTSRRLLLVPLRLEAEELALDTESSSNGCCAAAFA